MHTFAAQKRRDDRDIRGQSGIVGFKLSISRDGQTISQLTFLISIVLRQRSMGPIKSYARWLNVALDL